MSDQALKVIYCPRCRTKLEPGIVIKPMLYGSSDFGRDKGQVGTTFSHGPSDGTLEPCLKCPNCGYSIATSPIREA